MGEGLSIIICCYNSASRIMATLQYIVRQKVHDNTQWELLVVNNASTDNTAEVAGQVLKDTELDYRIIEEPQPGLSSARQTGLRAAKYSYVLFCDDDNHLEEEFVQRTFDLMKKNPKIGIAGCLIEPKFSSPPGAWIEDMYTSFAIGERSATEGEVDWVFGAGMALRKTLLDEWSNKGIRLFLSDRRGSKHTSGGDVEMCLLARKIGYSIYYTPDRVLHHQISQHRLSRWNILKTKYRNVSSTVYLFLLEQLLIEPDAKRKRLYQIYMKMKLKDIVHFTPRSFVGRHRFYSFVSAFQSLQLVAWLLMKRTAFRDFFDKAKQNVG